MLITSGKPNSQIFQGSLNSFSRAVTVFFIFKGTYYKQIYVEYNVQQCLGL